MGKLLEDTFLEGKGEFAKHQSEKGVCGRVGQSLCSRGLQDLESGSLRPSGLCVML